MLKKMLKNWPILIISLILLIIYAVNFTPGTYLIGWDNLMPELNIWMNIKRSLFAVWQEYQGLGLVGGMGHAADLIRQIILLPFTLILPNNWIRYLWHFGMLALGTFGVYFGVKHLHNTSEESVTDTVRGVIPLTAALFYLLNFGTVQLFWVPYEAFTTFWGFFPWLIFSFLAILKKPNKKNWRKFIIWNILAIPCFYIQTLFVVYGLCLGIISLNFLDKKLIIFKSSLIILLLNAFWLLPFGYFLITNSHHPTEALINRMSTEETFLRNQKRGYISNFLSLKGYYFDFPDAGSPLMEAWQNHFSSTPITIIGYVLGAVVILGLAKSIFSLFHRPRSESSHLEGVLTGLFLLSAVALLSATPPFSWLNYLLRQWPFLNQVFRSPFTKFIVPASFTFSLLFAHGIRYIDTSIHRNKIITAGLSVILGLGIIIYSWPVFRGALVYKKMRNQLPEKYTQLIDYFKNQPKTGRIANLPQGSFWGWTFYRFGPGGSGFLWYGIEQPILDRAFDVWNLKNEQYYWELTYGLQNQDLDLVEAVLNKYSVEYVIFDDGIIFPENKNWAKLALKTKALLDEADFLAKSATFDNLSIYKVKNVKTAPYITNKETAFNLLDSLPINQLSNEPKYEKPEIDEINLNDLQKIDEINIDLEDFVDPHNCAPETEKSETNYQVKNNQIILSASETALCINWKEYDYFEQFSTPKLIDINFEYQSTKDEWPEFCFWDTANQQCINRKNYPLVGFSQQWQDYSEKIIWNPEKEKISHLSFIADAYQKETKNIKYRNINLEIYEISPQTALPIAIKNPIEHSLVRPQPESCNKYQTGNYDLEFKPNEYLRLSSRNNNSCYTFAFNHLPLNQAWQVEIKYRNQQGYPLTAAASSLDGRYQIFQNILTDDKNWQTKYFLLPPYNTNQKGIQIQFNNNSFNYHETINDIAAVEVYPVNIDYPVPKPTAERKYLDFNSNIWRYKIETSTKGRYLVLPQTYDSGWVAAYFDGWQPKILKNHVSINNWANGWHLKNLKCSNAQCSKIYIVFWPQVLQFLGFGLLAGTIIWVFFRR